MALLLGICLGPVYDIFRILRIARGQGYGFGSTRIGRALRSYRKRLVNGQKGDNAPKIKRSFSKRIQTVWIFLEDILFGLIFALSVQLFLFDRNQGIVRWYLLLGIAVGFFAWYFTLGRLVVRFSAFLLALVRCVVLFLYNHTLFYLVFLFFRLAQGIGRVMKTIIRKMIEKYHLNKEKHFTIHELDRYARLMG